MTPAPFVSIVTPVYNGAEYLRECIDSIVGQTYANWDCTIVDNASTDATPDIAEHYAAQDSRIRLLRFEDFVDANANHNRAFQAIHPKSTYCKVVQADDWLFPECLTRMVEVATLSETIGIVSAYRLWARKLDLDGLPYETSVVSGRTVLRASLLGALHVTGGPTALLLRSSVVREREPFYDPTFRHDDTDAAYRILTRHDFGFAHQVLTFARRQKGARLETDARLGTHVPEHLVMLFRYGPLVLEPAELRDQVRRHLRLYLRFHTRQLPKISRLHDPEFFAFHRRAAANILAECHGDTEVKAAMGLVRSMLARGVASHAPEET